MLAIAIAVEHPAALTGNCPARLCWPCPPGPSSRWPHRAWPAAPTSCCTSSASGLGFLGTVDSSGGPRVHPLCPIICDGELYLLVVPGPKRTDLERDGRFALHSFPCPDDEDAAYLTGRAVVIDETRTAGDGRAAVPRRAFGDPDPARVAGGAGPVPSGYRTLPDHHDDGARRPGAAARGLAGLTSDAVFARRRQAGRIGTRSGSATPRRSRTRRSVVIPVVRGHPAGHLRCTTRGDARPTCRRRTARRPPPARGAPSRGSVVGDLLPPTDPEASQVVIDSRPWPQPAA